MSLDLFMALASFTQAGAQIGLGAAAKKSSGRQAQLAREAGAEEARLERVKGRKIAAKQRVAFAKSGVLIDEGTPLDVLAQTAADTELNALRAAFGFDQDADRIESAGNLALTEGLLGAGGTILGSKEATDLIAKGGKKIANRFRRPMKGTRGSPGSAAITRAGSLA